MFFDGIETITEYSVKMEGKRISRTAGSQIIIAPSPHRDRFTSNL